MLSEIPPPHSTFTVFRFCAATYPANARKGRLMSMQESSIIHANIKVNKKGQPHTQLTLNCGSVSFNALSVVFDRGSFAIAVTLVCSNFYTQ